MEIKEIEGFSDYYIDDQGNVYTSKRGAMRKKKTWVSQGKYENVSLSLDGKAYPKSVHRLVAEAFVPNPHYLPCVNHIDADKLNNSAGNLEWCTHKENMEHARSLGLYHCRGEKAGRSGCTEEQVHNVCFMLQSTTKTHKEIARDCNVTLDTVNHIARKACWVEISDKYKLRDRKSLTPPLEETQVREICEMLNQGLGGSDIEKIVGTTKQTVSKIKRGKAYKNISKKYLHTTSETIPRGSTL